MSQILILNQPQIAVGLNGFTYTVPATLPAAGGPISVSNTPFNITCQVIVPSAIASGNGSGSGVDLGLGALGGVQGIGQGSNLSLGNGGLGLGFGGSATDGAAAPIAYSPIASGLVVVVKQNGSTIFTAPALSPTQQAQQIKVDMLCTAADVILIAVSSSTASDEQLNGVQLQAAITTGV